VPGCFQAPAGACTMRAMAPPRPAPGPGLPEVSASGDLAGEPDGSQFSQLATAGPSCKPRLRSGAFLSRLLALCPD
jgi:hypothetical protein